MRFEETGSGGMGLSTKAKETDPTDFLAVEAPYMRTTAGTTQRKVPVPEQGMTLADVAGLSLHVQFLQASKRWLSGSMWSRYRSEPRIVRQRPLLKEKSDVKERVDLLELKDREHEEKGCVGNGNASFFRPMIFDYNDAPSFLKYNPYIRSGYRGYLNTKMCLQSVFWWTNETVNIWSHVFGWMLFFSLLVYDLQLLYLPASFADKLIMASLLICFQMCMILSSLYHIFSCHSEESYHRWLTCDLIGISFSLLAIYISGVYYAYWCLKFWQSFYIITVGGIFALALLIQLPQLRVSDNVRLAVFIIWAVYGVVPTLHWTLLNGGWDNPVVQILLPRIITMYCISGVAFFFYMSKLPERLLPGKCDFVGSSHQLWHVLVVGALYYWHNTGMAYVEFRLNYGCVEDPNY